MDAVVADIPELEYEARRKLLLNIQRVDLSVWRLQVVLNAGDIEWGLRSTRAEARDANAERNGCGGNDCNSACRAARILCEPLFEIVERNRVEVNAETGPYDGFAPGNQVERRIPCQGDAGPPITFRSVVKFSARKLGDRNESEIGIECGKTAVVLVDGGEEIVAQAGNQGEIRCELVVVHGEAADDVLVDVGAVGSYPRNLRQPRTRRGHSSD